MEAGVRDPWNPGQAFVPECPLCSGKLDKSARGLLSWAKMSACIDEESKFWELAQAVDVVERNQQSHPGLSGEALVQFVRALQMEVLTRSSGEMRSAWMNEQAGTDVEGDEPPDKSDEDLEGGEELPPGIEEIGPEEKAYIESIRSTVKSPSGRNKPNPHAGKARCCVEWFRTYGPYGPEMVEAPSVVGDHTTMISAAQVEFMFDMRFSDKGVCECDCCEFRQWILADEITSWSAPSEPQPEEQGVPKPPPGVPTSAPGAMEDCYWMVWDPADAKYKYARAERKPPPLTDTPKDKPVLGPYCYGNKEHAEESERLTGASPSQAFSEQNCKLLVVDRPAQGTPPPSWMIWHMTYAGVIHDACRNWAIVRAREMDFTVEAYFTEYAGESWAGIKKD